jgi:HlyD family secretion protein
MRQKIGIFIIMAVMAAFFTWVAYDFYKAYALPKKVVLQGEIDAQSYAVSSKLPGRIGEVFVKKGDILKVGDVVFTINSPEVTAKLHQAQAAKDAAAAKKAEADHGARKEQIRAAYEQYRKAKAAETFMQKTYKRVEKLYKQGVLSQQKRDEVATKYKAAHHTTNAAKELYIMAKKGARVEIKKAAAAQERVYAAKVDEVDAYVKETKAYAFHDAEVSEVLLHSGELAPSGFPVVMSLDMNDVWARFAVREDYLHYFKKGEQMQLRIPALGKSYAFKVTYIAPMGDFATWRATESGKAFDMKSFEVELRPVQKIEGLRVGMSVLVEL